LALKLSSYEHRQHAQRNAPCAVDWQNPEAAFKEWWKKIESNLPAAFNLTVQHTDAKTNASEVIFANGRRVRLRQYTSDGDYELTVE
jgi:hypothetical protein